MSLDDTFYGSAQMGDNYEDLDDTRHGSNVVEFFRILSNMGSKTIHFEELKYSDLVQKYRDRPIREMDIRAKTGANIIGLLDDKNQFMVNPRPDEIISRGMALIVLGDKIQVDKFCAEYVNR